MRSKEQASLKARRRANLLHWRACGVQRALAVRAVRLAERKHGKTTEILMFFGLFKFSGDKNECNPHF